MIEREFRTALLDESVYTKMRVAAPPLWPLRDFLVLRATLFRGRFIHPIG